MWFDWSEPLFRRGETTCVLPRDRNNPRLLRKAATPADLRRCRLFLFRRFCQRSTNAYSLAVSGVSEGRRYGNRCDRTGIFGDFASEEALPRGTEWNEPDP